MSLVTRAFLKKNILVAWEDEVLATVHTNVPNIYGSSTVPIVSNEKTSGEKMRSLHSHLLFLFPCVSGRVEGRDQAS